MHVWSSRVVVCEPRRPGPGEEEKKERKGGTINVKAPKTAGFHTTTRELQTCTFERPGASNTTKIHKKIPREERKERVLWREREKKARNFGPPTLRPPTLRGPYPSGPLPFVPPHPSCPPPVGAPLFLGWAPHPSNPPPFEPHPSNPHPRPTQNTQKKLEQLISKNPNN